MITIIDLRTEYREKPINICVPNPRFSWKLETEKTGVFQKAYSFEAALDEGFTKTVWKSGIVESAASHLVPYGGEALKQATVYYWRVKVWDNQGGESDWAASYFETTLFSPSEWKGVIFISGEDKDSGASSAGHLLRKEFNVNGKIKRARLYTSAKGMYEARINGEKAGDEILSPGWTEYKSRLLFQTFDITDNIIEGKNALGIMTAPGWYKGDLAGWLGKRNVYGTQTAAIAQLRLEYEDGRTETIVTDKSWKRARSPVVDAELYNGETHDARLEQRGWDEGGFDDSPWENVFIESSDTSTLSPHDGLPVTVHEVFKPLSVIKTPAGDTVLDFGQNISGRVRFRVQGKAGDKVKIRHAETLDAAGNFYTENLRKAKQTVEYILRGGGEETHEARFTFQGFRYIAIDECPGEVNKNCFEARSIYSDLRETGTFRCSNEKINQFMSNVRWSMKDNFVDIPTDCPQRDERLGWTGDAHIFMRTACCLAEVAPFFKKWLRDLSAAQTKDGEVTHVVPDVLKKIGEIDSKITTEAGACAWADAAVGIPWLCYIYFGDTGILAEQYPSMKKWVDYIQGVSQDGVLFNSGFHFGDWVALDAKEGSYFGATPNDLCATAYYAYSADILSKTASLLGKKDDAVYYAGLRKKIGEAYSKEFFTPSGRLAARTQTAHILSLAFDLTPAEFKKRTVDTLVELIAEQKNHLNTGFLGTPYVCRVLAENGQSGLAYELLLKEDFPSWLYQVVKGATTIWEHWDGLKPDGTMWSPDMNSFNHYAYGAVADWVFSSVGGIDTSREYPAFKKAILKPLIPKEKIDWAETSYQTPYGKLSLKWEKKNGGVTYNIIVPPNASAVLCLPDGSEKEFGSGSWKV